jgi:parallel beta-helix repeat protein
MVLAGILVACTVATAGGLDPDGSPGSTMRTLEEVEPSTPIGASDLPLTIDTAGTTYHLTESVSGLSSTAITVDAADVTIDLKGFTLSGDGTAASYGISGTANAEGVELRNGRISGFRFGVALNSTTRSRLVDLRVTGNVYTGIEVGSGAEVIRCEAADNGSHGISTSGDGVLRESVARNNGGHGIYGGTETLVVECVAESNDQSGIVTGNKATVRDSVANDNGSDGIEVASGLVEGCTAAGNAEDGIQVTDETFVLNNKASGNGYSNGGAGIHATGQLNRIEGNHLTGNDSGVLVDSGGNTIVRNSARGNITASYDIFMGNDVGPLGKAHSATSPWANLDY